MAFFALCSLICFTYLSSFINLTLYTEIKNKQNDFTSFRIVKHKKSNFNVKNAK